MRRSSVYLERFRSYSSTLSRKLQRRLGTNRGEIDRLRAAAGLPLKSASSGPREQPSIKRVRRIEQASDDRAHLWIVVPGGIQYFRFVESGAFTKIEAAYRVTYVLPDPDCKRRIPRALDDFKHDEIIFTPVDERRRAVWGFLFEVSCCALKSRCTSFRIRYEMERLGRLRKARSLSQRLFARIPSVLASRPLFGRFRRNLIRSLGAEPALARALAEDRPAAILVPSSLYDALTNEVIVTAREAAVPTIILQNSWDNLSSKGIVAVPPDFMGVWGEQSVNHAVDLQDMSRERCIVVGSPYYESFFRRPRRSKTDARRSLGLAPDELVVLFGGSFRQFDEAALLRRIEDAIDNGRLPRMLVFYRPHPGRELRDETNFFDFHWRHTVMDEEVAVVYRANVEGRMISQNEFGYDLDRLADIYTAVDLTISPMSSIVLESLLFGLPVLGIGYSDGRNLWGPEKTSQMTHFKELKEVPCVQICHHPDEFLDDLRVVLDWVKRPDIAATAGESARFFVDNGEETYATRALDLVRSVVPQLGESPARSPKSDAYIDAV